MLDRDYLPGTNPVRSTVGRYAASPMSVSHPTTARRPAGRSVSLNEIVRSGLRRGGLRSMCRPGIGTPPAGRLAVAHRRPGGVARPRGGVGQPHVACPRRAPASQIPDGRADVIQLHTGQARTGQRRSYALRVLVRCVFVRRGDPVPWGIKRCDSSIAAMRGASSLRSRPRRLGIRYVPARSRPYRAGHGQTPWRPSRRGTVAPRGLHETKAS
jgi:hypothetical protein